MVLKHYVPISERLKLNEDNADESPDFSISFRDHFILSICTTICRYVIIVLQNKIMLIIARSKKKATTVNY